jgi:DHA1 family tetracycline resistance protein-like MFS transporter
MNQPLIAIYCTVILDAMGIGIIFPILPALLKDITHTDNVALYLGILTALYAVMQFIFAPMLGMLSDRFGRRPVLLLSLGGATVNYLFLSLSPTLSLLLLARAFAGMTGASVSVAMAYITDISPLEKRTRRFGLSSAMFGIGFIIGPALGGMLGDYWVRLPFLAASILNGGNFLLALLVLPETSIARRDKINLSALNPWHSLGGFLALKGVMPVVMTFFVLSFAGEAYGICWALWGHDAFQWSGYQIGLSLATFGFFQTVVQIFLPGPAARILGERRAVLAGLICVCTALCAMAFASEGWMVFAIMPVFALGSIGTPALQALATRKVAPDQQGQFQGILSSATSLSSVIAPLLFSVLYFAVQNSWPGAIWLCVVVINAIAVPLVISGTRNSQTDQSQRA